MKMRIVALIGVVVLLAAACGGGGGTGSTAPSGGTSAAPASAPASATAPAEKVELTLLADVSDQQPTTLWQGLFDKFTAKYPNITVKLVPTSPGSREQTAKTLLATGNFPDVQFSLPPATFKDEMLPFDQKDPEISGQLLNIAQLTIGGNLYTLGIELGIWNTVFYNKADFQKAGITNVPTTFAEFDADLAKLKAAGITPLLGAGDTLEGFTFMVLNDIFAETPCWYGLREQGKVHFTDSEWVNAATRFASYVQKGYFNLSPLGLPFLQAFNLFLTDKAPAMFPFGSSYSGTVAANPPKNFEIGIFPMPNRSDPPVTKLVGSIGLVGYSVSKTTKHPAEAVQLAKWLALDPDSLTTLLNSMGNDPNVKPISGPLTGITHTPLQGEISKIISNAVSFNTGWAGEGDCAARPGAQFAIGTLVAGPLYLNPTQPVLPLLQKLDAFWDNANPASSPSAKP
jgi:ABC-type glycerol-3-phosphate transport system substrate-binding protein